MFPPWLDATLHAVTVLERSLPFNPPRRRIGTGDGATRMSEDDFEMPRVPLSAVADAAVGLSIVVPVYRGAATVGKLVEVLSVL